MVMYNNVVHDQAVAALTQQMVQLEVKDQTRRSDRFPLPSAGLAKEFELLGCSILKCERRTIAGKQRNIVTNFGIPVIVMAKTWELMIQFDTMNPKMQQRHFLWALHYLKAYPAIGTMGVTMKQDKDKKKSDDKTLVKWIWIVIECIYELHPHIIVWENRKTNDVGNDCLAVVDCVDCNFQQILIPNPDKPGKKMMNKALNSFKMKKPGLRYEIASSLKSSDIVWISGPFLPGDFNDLSVFRAGLLYMLEDDERIEADCIYVAEAPHKVKCPSSAECIGSQEEYNMRARAQGRCEQLNKHVKNWRCVSHPFVAKGSPEVKIDKHKKMTFAVTVLKQIAMEMGFNELWELGDAYDENSNPVVTNN